MQLYQLLIELIQSEEYFLENGQIKLKETMIKVIVNFNQ